MSQVHNPLLPGTYPDPSICRVGEDFYLVTSTFEYFPGLPVFHSRDLVSWEQIGHVIDRAGQLDYEGIASSGGLYAPTIRYHDGTFWVVCTLVERDEPGSHESDADDPTADGAVIRPPAARSGNFLVTATDPAGEWSDPVWLDADGIDPSILFDDDRVWIHGTRQAADPEWPEQGEIWLREYDPRTRALIGPDHILWTGAVRGAVWAEGPHLYAIDGAYYLLAAEGGTEYFHAESVARAETVTGPYIGFAGNPVLTHRHFGQGADVAAVGHADLVQAPDGSWWAVTLGVRPYGGYHYNRGRETFLVPVEWQDGWPVFAPGQGRVPSVVDVPFAGPPHPGVAQGGASGVVAPGDPRWTSLRGPATFAEATGSGWDLRMLPATLTEPTTPAFLGVRQQHQDVDVRVRLRVEPAPGEEAGLVVRQSEADHVKLFVERDPEARDAGAGEPGPDGAGTRGAAVGRILAVHRRAGVETVLGEQPWDGSAVTLSVQARGQDYALVVGADDDLDGAATTSPGEPGALGNRGADDDGTVVAVVDGRMLDSAAAGGFVGLWFGVYATSNGRPTTTVTHVERFEYVPR